MLMFISANFLPPVSVMLFDVSIHAKINATLHATMYRGRGFGENMERGFRA